MCYLIICEVCGKRESEVGNLDLDLDFKNTAYLIGLVWFGLVEPSRTRLGTLTRTALALRGAASRRPNHPNAPLASIFFQWDYPRRNPTLPTGRALPLGFVSTTSTPTRSNRGERRRRWTAEQGEEEAMDGGAGRPHHPRRLAAAKMAMVGGAAVPAGGTSSFGNAPRGETKVISLSSRVIA